MPKSREIADTELAKLPYESRLLGVDARDMLDTLGRCELRGRHRLAQLDPHLTARVARAEQAHHECQEQDWMTVPRSVVLLM